MHSETIVLCHFNPVIVLYNIFTTLKPTLIWILFCTRIFVGSWNVGGIAPPKNLDMEDWLDTENNSSDIYVLG